ncbi:MAG TPA: hypothetical protein VGO93_19660 [Candidatus Xenobia bacterium]|jgi:GNAT superfamily N-acetyltransferase
MSGLSIRSATPHDVDTLLSLLALHPWPGRPVRGVSEGARLEYRQNAYRSYAPVFGSVPYVDGWVGLQGETARGFMVLLNDMTDSITGDPQSQILDFAVPDDACLDALLDKALPEARRKSADYVVVELGVDDPEAERLQRHGFIHESTRIARRMTCEPSDEVRRSMEAYRVRPGNASDLMFVTWLSTVSSQNLAPAGRTADSLTVRTRFVDCYLNSNVTGADDVKTLICERLSDDEQVGYLLLKFMTDEVTGEKLGYCYDIAVKPEDWGSGVSQYLSHAGEKLFADLGVHVCIGDISAANPRPLIWATRHLGYDIESRKWARRLS